MGVISNAIGRRGVLPWPHVMVVPRLALLRKRRRRRVPMATMRMGVSMRVGRRMAVASVACSPVGVRGGVVGNALSGGELHVGVARGQDLAGRIS